MQFGKQQHQRILPMLITLGITSVFKNTAHAFRCSTSCRNIMHLNHKSVSFSPQKSKNYCSISSTATEEVVTTSRKVEEVQIVNSMPDFLPMNLKNHYYLLRHGQSTANVAGIISSSRTLAYSKKHGLTPLGYQQAYESSKELLKELEMSSSKDTSENNLIFISSPFARAIETAEACIDGLLSSSSDEDSTINKCVISSDDDDDKTQNLHLNNGKTFKFTTEVTIKEKLMERYFGRLDDKELNTYAYVWPIDKFNVTHTAFDVESVAAVATRLGQLILELEEEYSGENNHIVLVSHADVLQICQLYGANAPNVGLFSSYRFGNGEIRKLERSVDSLPEPKPLEAPYRGTRTEMPK